MAENKALVQSDSSAQSKQSIGSQPANQSPATSKGSRRSSGGITRMLKGMSTIHEKATPRSRHKQKSSHDPVNHPAKKPSPKKQNPDDPLGSKGGRVSKSYTRKEMLKVIEITKETMGKILSKTELEGTRFSFVANKHTVVRLKPDSVEFPDLTTVVKVVPGDTYDRALEMQDAGNASDHMPVCVLNFANAHTPGGGWLNGARAQEEQLCYRSTLIGALQPRLYPMEDLECLYSPNVIVYRKSADNGYSFMSADDKLHLNPSVSVISMAARKSPALTADKSTYIDQGQRQLMKDKMRLILRTAAVNNHRRLVLGALGCGAFRHPTQQVADCWKEVLGKVEFKGWFEQIQFVIRDGPYENNLAVFTKTLDGLNLG
ncbi:hypothetical protein N7491_003332 [Penicillium cf. griseofulvum]|uniref:Microbial-type PARG catalytic domain-containing protein n=1 Tax=Penicillium cf. griseofulvum TaxID=2972120 RepID=A0A9W9MRF3_9EURO|nr:hypothetical protein N7472_002496 [Penicillium cf. griseofulvum]KAJ5440926.1 hypothetical protein N7491_003332 [Penicillium cf. griseofulvum]KAJ5448971.1 hypothetical protein N7445_003792 [Penicillium cf. griseofulvum]